MIRVTPFFDSLCTYTKFSNDMWIITQELITQTQSAAGKRIYWSHMQVSTLTGGEFLWYTSIKLTTVTEQWLKSHQCV